MNLKISRGKLIWLTTTLLSFTLCAVALAQDDGASGGDGAEGSSDFSNVLGEDFKPPTKISSIRGLKNTKSSTTSSTYRVKAGDTLWDITERFFKSPYLWPALWSYNPHITNPHWIFPDDIIFLRPPADAQDASAAELLGVTREAGVMVLMGAFYTAEEVDQAPRVLYSPEEKSMITLTDEVYLDFPDTNGLREGQAFAILKIVDTIKDEDDEVIAYKLRVAGSTVLLHADDSSLPIGRVTDAYYEIERGDLLFAYEDQLVRIIDRSTNADLQGTIIDSLEFTTTVGEQQIVFIDLGSDDGILNGNTLLVYEQRDGLEELVPDDELSDDDRAEGKKSKGDLPRRLIGEILVVRTTGSYATGLIVNSLREINVGQKVVTYRGR